MREDLKEIVSGVTGSVSMAALKQITSKTAWKGAVIGSLGQLPFLCSRKQVLTFTDLSEENAVRWAKHEVIGKKPVLEYIGPDLKIITLTIRLDAALGAPPLVYLNRLERMMLNGKYKTFIVGGEYIGRFVIKNMSKARKFFTGAGICQVALVTIELEEYGK